jgi:predicted membrane protein
MKWNGWRLFWGLLLVIVGGLWLWNNLDIGPRIPLGSLWPLLLIGLGAYIILRQAGRVGHINVHGEATGAVIDRILGDVRLGGPGATAQNSNILSIIGDVDIDLRQSTIPDGETTIRVRSLIGDIDIILPADVAVFAGASVVIGELRVMDKRRDGFFLDLASSTPDYATAARKIRIEVDMLIGDAMIMRGS